MLPHAGVSVKPFCKGVRMSCTLFGGMGGRVGWLGWVKWIIVSVLLIGFVGGENGMGEKKWGI